jgi:ferrous iron transport protein B
LRSAASAWPRWPLATIRRETNSWTWPAFVFTYMTVLAVGAAWAVFHLSMALHL